MLLTQLSVWSQAVAAGFFLILFLTKVQWWKSTVTQMLSAMTTVLFALTLYLAITATDEGLNTAPPFVLVTRFAFVGILLYGIVRLEGN